MSGTIAGTPGTITVIGGERGPDVHLFNWEIEATIHGALAVHRAIRKAEGDEDRQVVLLEEHVHAVTHIATGREVAQASREACEAFAWSYGAHPWWGTVAVGRTDPADVPPDLWAALWPLLRGSVL